MAERDPDMETYAAIKAALLAYVPFTEAVPEGNRIWLDDVEGLQDFEKTESADGDYHESILWPVSGADSLLSSEGSQTFGRGCDVLEMINLNYRLEIVSPYIGIRTISTAGQHAIRALRLAGWDLGQEYIDKVRVRWETERIVLNDTQRWQHRIDILVDTQFKAVDLT